MGLNRQFRPATAALIANPVPKPAPPIEEARIAPKASAKRGPKPSGNAKVLLTLRLDPDVIAKFKATGAGWQAKMNECLKQAKV